MNDNTEYKIQIDKDIYSVDHPLLTGRELLDVAKKKGSYFPMRTNDEPADIVD